MPWPGRDLASKAGGKKMAIASPGLNLVPSAGQERPENKYANRELGSELGDGGVQVWDNVGSFRTNIPI